MSTEPAEPAGPARWPGWAAPRGTPGPPPPRRVGPVAAPPGTPYDQQARNGLQRWWRQVLGTVVVLLATLMGLLGLYVGAAGVAELLGAQPVRPHSEEVFDAPLAEQALGLISLAVLIPAVMLAARSVELRPPGTLSSVTGRLRWRWLAACLGVAAPLLVLQMGLLIGWASLRGDDDLDAGAVSIAGWPSLLLSLVVLWALVPFQAAAEEYAFRGWFQQVFGAHWNSPWAGIVISSLLFALAHGLGELSGFALLFYSAVWWAWLCLRTGGLEATIAAHVVNNLISFTLVTATGELDDTSSAADAAWQALVLELIFAPLYCLVVIRLARRKGIAVRTP